MSTRASNLNYVLNYELAAVPTSKWAEDFHVKFHPQAKTPGGSYQSVNRYSRRWVIGGCARLCVLQWPSKGFIKNIVLNFIKYATNMINSYNGHMQYLIDITRASRMPSASSCVSEHGMLQGNTNRR